MRLKDNVAIVTGGGGGIGEGICLCLAKEGAHVIVSDMNKELADRVVNKVKEIGRKALAIKTDVRVAKECRDLIDKTLSEMGRIDILVCGAGLIGPEAVSERPANIEDIPEEVWGPIIDVNLKGVFLCNQAIASHFRKQKKGKIINISSIAGRKGSALNPHYSAAKAGVIIFSQAVALQLAPFNVNVNTICPGFLWTPLWDNIARNLSLQIPRFKSMDLKDIFDTFVKEAIPLKRPQTPEDIGNAVVFLASAEADQITGQALNVDGGAVCS